MSNEASGIIVDQLATIVIHPAVAAGTAAALELAGSRTNATGAPTTVAAPVVLVTSW